MPISTMFIRLTLLLLCCSISYSGATTVGKHVTGRVGGNATLPCDMEARDISHVSLGRLSKDIPVCQSEECQSRNWRIFKKGLCDIIIMALGLSDAGKYILTVYVNNVQERQIAFSLHIQGEISVNTGEQLKLDLLLTNVHKVETNSSGEWTEVWTRGHGVSSDRLNDSDGNLTINAFTSNDTGTYRVLDSEGETLITLTLTESGTGSDSKRTDDTEQHTATFWTLSVGLPLVLVLVLVLVGVIMFIVFRKHKCQNKSYSLGHQCPEDSGL
ncbi:uncharacterized protein [Pseudorasbora parva]|uniref:uncharacterized protein n=1 Tax=Pseudorasbora parva TaxID=51549 RepID=UPI00351F206A